MNEQTTVLAPAQHVTFGKSALKELRALVKNRPDSDKLVINGRQYLYFTDWQILGAFFGVYSMVTETKQLVEEVQSKVVEGMTKLKPIGYSARAEVRKDGAVIGAAEAICMDDEANWSKKPLFQLLSMAQTRACAKALRQCLGWVVRLPDSTFAEESAEEIQWGQDNNVH